MVDKAKFKAILDGSLEAAVKEAYMEGFATGYDYGASEYNYDQDGGTTGGGPVHTVDDDAESEYYRFTEFKKNRK